MAIRRVFRARVKCPGIRTDLGPTANQHRMVGRKVMFEKLSSSEVNIIMDGAVVGQLDAAVANPVALALERGQSFTAAIEKAFPMYSDKFKQTGAYIDIKVEYLLEKGQPAIETIKCWRCVDSSLSAEPYTPGSFFTAVAGVSHEGRQRIVKLCSIGERLILVRDPNNRFDKGAIKVMRSNGDQLGFIRAHVSRGGDPSGLAFQMDHRGTEYRCVIKDITGGGPGKPTRGVNIEITEVTNGEDHEALVRRRIGELTTTKSDAAPTSPGATAQLLWIPTIIIIIACILWVVFRFTATGS